MIECACVHEDEILVSGPYWLEFETDIAEPAEVIQARDKVFLCGIHTVSNSILNWKNCLTNRRNRLLYQYKSGR